MAGQTCKNRRVAAAITELSLPISTLFVHFYLTTYSFTSPTLSMAAYAFGYLVSLPFQLYMLVALVV